MKFNKKSVMCLMLLSFFCHSSLSKEYRFRVSANGVKEPVIYNTCYDTLTAGKSTGNGVYELESGPYYCDMNSGGWTMIFKQSIEEGYYTELNALSRNIENPGESILNYSALKNLESFKRDGRFEFLIEWPRDFGYVNHWYQATNPTKDMAVSGYTPINIGTTIQYWGGLERNCEIQCISSFIDGSINHVNSFYSIASYRQWGGGIPAGSETIAAKQTVLWVK